jgi:hypothetical protein
MRAFCGLILAAALAGIAGLAGCASVASVGPETSLSQPAATRAGSVYLLRGFMGITGGIDELRDELGRLGLRATAYDPEQWQGVAAAIIAQRKAHPDSGPIILVGFSASAGDAIRVSRALDGFLASAQSLAVPDIYGRSETVDRCRT